MAERDATWRVWLMGVMLTIIMALCGLTYQQSVDASQELRNNDRHQDLQIQEARDRILRIEQWMTFQQQQLDRIEKGINELKTRR